MENTWTIRSFSINSTDVCFLVKLREAGVRDGRSQSEMVVIAIKEYVDKHIPANPQATLERSFSTGQPAKPSWQCCVERCRAKAKVRLQLKDFQGKTEFFPVCLKHKDWRHKDFRFLISYKELL